MYNGYGIFYGWWNITPSQTHGRAYSALRLALGFAFDYTVGGVEGGVCNETTETPPLDTRRLIYDRSFF